MMSRDFPLSPVFTLDREACILILISNETAVVKPMSTTGSSVDDAADTDHPEATARPKVAAHQTRVRVRFPEADQQGIVHHSVYLHYFELGRTEMLRDFGLPYTKLEKQGTHLVVTETKLRFIRSAYYDDVLLVKTHVDRLSRVRIYLSYEVLREQSQAIVCAGSTTLAALDSSGKPTALPSELRQLLGVRARSQGG